LYLIGTHPDVEAKLHSELDAVLGGRVPTVADVPALQYTNMIVSEALRLYPPIPVGARRAIEDHELGGYPIPAGSNVILSSYVVHRDPRWHPHPLEFDPERWNPDAPASQPKFAYFPFGGGPRLCIGEAFSWMELTLTLATVAARWTMRPVPDHPVHHHARFSLRPTDGLKMELSARS
ncbi:MAG: cytochrome P450, partial [Actinomycetota bacterium]